MIGTDDQSHWPANIKPFLFLGIPLTVIVQSARRLFMPTRDVVSMAMSWLVMRFPRDLLSFVILCLLQGCRFIEHGTLAHVICT